MFIANFFLALHIDKQTKQWVVSAFSPVRPGQLEPVQGPPYPGRGRPRGRALEGDRRAGLEGLVDERVVQAGGGVCIREKRRGGGFNVLHVFWSKAGIRKKEARKGLYYSFRYQTHKLCAGGKVWRYLSFKVLIIFYFCTSLALFQNCDYCVEEKLGSSVLWWYPKLVPLLLCMAVWLPKKTGRGKRGLSGCRCLAAHPKKALSPPFLGSSKKVSSLVPRKWDSWALPFPFSPSRGERKK